MMRTIIIPFLPRYNREELTAPPLEKLTNTAWKFSQCALWPEQEFDLVEEEAVRGYIREYFTAATDKKRAFTALIQRVILTQKYIRRDRERFLPDPYIWFNRRYPFGFAGTLAWLHNVEQQRKDVPGYLAHIEALAHGYYDYIVRPSLRRFNRCRDKMLRHRAPILLQLFYNAVIHLNYVRAQAMNTDLKSNLSGVSFALKAYTLKQLSELYGVSTKTFHRWLQPFTENIGERQGYFYSISQVKSIISHLGAPGNVLVE